MSASRFSVYCLISPHTFKPVKLATVRRWTTKVPRDAGVTVSAGSTRPTATSCALLHDVPLQNIMNAADWSHRDTPFRHYIRILPAETIRRIDPKQMQDAVLPQ